MERTTATGIFITGVTVVLGLWLLCRYERRVRLPCPPGPKGLPLLGNIAIPSEHQWLRFAELTKEYGDIFSLTVLGKKIIVLGSVKAVTDLLEKRSVDYSSRPEAYMVGHLMRYDWNMALMPDSDVWKQRRHVFDSYFRQRDIPKFYQTLTREAHMTLRRLLERPERFLEHCGLLFGATILDIVYGLQSTSHEDPILINGERVMRSLSEASVHGRFWVEMIPLMRYIPSWVPGAGFQRQARLWKSWGEDFVNVPWDRAKQNRDNGHVKPSFASKMLDEMDHTESSLEELVFKPAAATGYAGGSGTTVGTLQSVFLAMCLFPEVLKRAQAELDDVVGDQRLPTFDDRPLLPYINALMKEATRWMPVAPLGLPHFSIRDNVYRGYLIPKGSVVIGNSWGLLHDSDLYGPNTNDFSPERFLSQDGQLNPDVPDPIFAFGYGRRRCPGRYLSDAALFIAVANILHVFNITPPMNANGVETQLNAKQKPHVLAPPETFKCIIQPRSKAATALVQNLGFD
ncbi:cytochrome P450, partial [Mycena floridula]